MGFVGTDVEGVGSGVPEGMANEGPGIRGSNQKRDESCWGDASGPVCAGSHQVRQVDVWIEKRTKASARDRKTARSFPNGD